LTPAETAVYDRAFAFHRTRDDQAAWRILAPLVAAHPGAPELGPLLCRLSGLPPARVPGSAACASALAHAANDDPGPFVDAAQAALSRQDFEPAQDHAREAAVRAGRATPSDPSAWLAIAQVDLQLGALTWAEAALARAGDEPAVATTRAQVQRARRFFGLPVPAPKLPPEREPACAGIVTRTNEALAARKLAAARAMLEAGLRQCPGGPGLLTLACDLAMREGHSDRALDHCVAALAGMEDQPRAHFLLGTLQLARGKGDPAISSFRHAAALDPTEAAYWDGLAEAYAAFGHDQELRALPAERARALAPGQPHR
jgi:predicted Zn-dependent protease